MTELYLVRHGETDWNAERRIQGSADIPLNDVGRAQAARTGRLLARRTWDCVVSSPLSRAFETATIIAATLQMPAPVTLDAIVERRYGEAEGLDYRTLERVFPRGVVVPGRESREEVTQRVIPALVRLAKGHRDEKIVVVTHGGVIRAVVNEVEQNDPEMLGIPISNGSVHSFRYLDGHLELVAFDDPIDWESVLPGAEDFVDQDASE